MVVWIRSETFRRFIDVGLEPAPRRINIKSEIKCPVTQCKMKKGFANAELLRRVSGKGAGRFSMPLQNLLNLVRGLCS